MEDAGAGAIVLRSLFEEEINSEIYELDRFLLESSDDRRRELQHLSQSR